MRKSKIYNVHIGNEKASLGITVEEIVDNIFNSFLLIPFILPIYLGKKVVIYLGKRIVEEIKISKNRSAVLDEQLNNLPRYVSNDKFNKIINSTSLAQFSEKINSMQGIVNYYSNTDFEKGINWIYSTYNNYMNGKLIQNPTNEYSNIILKSLLSNVCMDNLPLLSVNTSSLNHIKTKEQGLFLPPIFGLTNKCIIYKDIDKRVTFKETTYIIKNGNLNISIDEYVNMGKDLNRELAYILVDIDKAIGILVKINNELEINNNPKKHVFLFFKKDAYSNKVKQYYTDQLRLLFAYYKLLLEESLIGVNNLYNELINMNNELMK